MTPPPSPFISHIISTYDCSARPPIPVLATMLGPLACPSRITRPIYNTKEMLKNVWNPVCKNDRTYSLKKINAKHLILYSYTRTENQRKPLNIFYFEFYKSSWTPFKTLYLFLKFCIRVQHKPFEVEVVLIHYLSIFFILKKRF